MNSIARPPSICKRNLEFSLNFMIPPAQRQRRRTCSVFSARRVLSLAANEREPILPNNRNFVNRLAGKNRRCKRRCQRKNDGIPRQRIPTEKRVQATINTALFPPSCWLFSHGKNVSESALSSRPEPLKKTISVHIRTARFAPFFCRADVRQSSDRRERKSHAERRVRQDAKASCPGLGETPTSSAVISKRISRCTACIRFRNVSFLECLRTGKIFCFWAVSY